MSVSPGYQVIKLLSKSVHGKISRQTLGIQLDTLEAEGERVPS